MPTDPKLLRLAESCGACGMSTFFDLKVAA